MTEVHVQLRAMIHSYMASPISLNKPGLNNFNDLSNKIPGEPLPGQIMEISTVAPAYMVHGCKVNPLIWSIFGWSQYYNSYSN